MNALHAPVLDWYAAQARALPWRRPDATPWGVLVSEVMLQQTPVARVLPVWQLWMEQWPHPADLVAAGPGEAVRAWGKLGYPRRALRLHAAATELVAHLDGQVPDDLDLLRGLPGVGDYTAAAVASFAFGRRHAVLDTNVRRVFARVQAGCELPPPHLSVAERRRAADLLPEDEATAARWSVAVMELGALVCKAASPRCQACPVAELCAWRAAGYPAYDGPPRKAQSFGGTDRQCRGALMDVLRSSTEPVPRPVMDAAWVDAEQRERCLQTLLVDGLAVHDPDRGSYALP